MAPPSPEIFPSPRLTAPRMTLLKPHAVALCAALLGPLWQRPDSRGPMAAEGEGVLSLACLPAMLRLGALGARGGRGCSLCALRPDSSLAHPSAVRLQRGPRKWPLRVPLWESWSRFGRTRPGPFQAGGAGCSQPCADSFSCSPGLSCSLLGDSGSCWRGQDLRRRLLLVAAVTGGSSGGGHSR